MKLKLCKIGNSLGVMLPKEVLEKFKLSEGDSLSLIETKEGIQLTPDDSEFEKAIAIYREGSIKYTNALRDLAK
ncbi:AbrB/MazE/SpoVT family DNA-binding domain-containing protein [Crocosphaera chwakensis]|uniref:Putative addiction module antidote n=1 Tax=Crocosphaera chwakensis CCY0110 TaxID=391612 RepID=A3IYC1_9CHRO|nr:AbrB/MazE/SpoVT family DNA-binding domain-containing protein [Crocosphaera chwakensis]EAZ88529.1 putative addiction module antidote [Crocosphaera chwakensis CCY0110]